MSRFRFPVPHVPFFVVRQLVGLNVSFVQRWCDGMSDRLPATTLNLNLNVNQINIFI